MAHFKFAKDIDELVKMDGPLQTGPMMRWQRKAQETLIRVHRDDEGKDSFCNIDTWETKGLFKFWD